MKEMTTVQKRKRGGKRCAPRWCVVVSLPMGRESGWIKVKGSKKNQSWLDSIFKVQYPMQRPYGSRLLRTRPSAFCRKFDEKSRATSQKRTCEDVNPWLQSMSNHLYWTASSSPAGISELIVAKWHTVELHIKHRQKPGRVLPFACTKKRRKSGCSQCVVHSKIWVKPNNWIGNVGKTAP